ncbi:hypothetical protein AYI70_g5691 [Smittium culicis]|uniref:Uncharacterized protein n=1 Tax=Smittium culicis TaxID=133412 RepID=A0A1R1XTD3_9FUNG|nr:hypothetical protein AYI70_g5691 [Smittium culicis]
MFPCSEFSVGVLFRIEWSLGPHTPRNSEIQLALLPIFARLDVGDGSALTSFHTSDGTSSAPGASLFGVSASAHVISDHSIVLSHSG